jgi:hypothetical protein
MTVWGMMVHRLDPVMHMATKSCTCVIKQLKNGMDSTLEHSVTDSDHTYRIEKKG